MQLKQAHLLVNTSVNVDPPQPPSPVREGSEEGSSPRASVSDNGNASDFTARHLGGARFLSESPICHIVGAERCGSNSRDGYIGKLVICDYTPSSPGNMVLEKTVPIDLMRETGTIGASKGWVATLKDGVVCLQDDLNPSASDSKPKRISLPPLATLPHCQTQLVTSVAMSSSSPDEDEDCILPVKFAGPQLSLCRPALKDKSEWVNFRIEDPGFFSSRLMYSKWSKMFFMMGSGGMHKGSWDLEKHIPPNLMHCRYHVLEKSQWERMSMCCCSEHLVESPSGGEKFLVKWYTRYCAKTRRPLWERFMVYEVSDQLVLRTDDIGDLCIFLSFKGEPFSLPVILYGLTPNCIYYVGSYDFGKVNISDNVRVGGGFTFSPAPYFIPPSTLLY